LFSFETKLKENKGGHTYTPWEKPMTLPWYWDELGGGQWTPRWDLTNMSHRSQAFARSSPPSFGPPCCRWQDDTGLAIDWKSPSPDLHGPGCDNIFPWNTKFHDNRTQSP
jgi:hypothetical protein